MLECESYKMLFGTGLITPVNGKEPFTERGTWFFKPEFNVWYVNGKSYPAEIVEIVEDLT